MQRVYVYTIFDCDCEGSEVGNFKEDNLRKMMITIPSLINGTRRKSVEKNCKD